MNLNAYTYTADGKLATRTWARGVVTTYAYDGWGNLTSVTYSDGTPSDAYLMHDGNKNVTDVIAAGAAATQLAHYDYAPFGAVRAQTGSRAAANPYRFSSEFSDDTLGLVYYNYRHYDPTTGRWLSRDPDSGIVDLYVYCHNSPEMYIDERGGHPAILAPYVAPAATAIARAVAEVAIKAATETVIALSISKVAKQCCRRCRPCNPAEGKKMYEIHRGHTHNGWDPHIHYYTVHQSPPDAGCRCFTSGRGNNVEPGETPGSDAIPFRRVTGGGYL